MALQTETIQVSGIRCERCVNRLAAALGGHDGLEAANANLMGEVDARPGTTSAPIATRSSRSSREAGFREAGLLCPPADPCRSPSSAGERWSARPDAGRMCVPLLDPPVLRRLGDLLVGLGEPVVARRLRRSKFPCRSTSGASWRIRRGTVTNAFAASSTTWTNSRGTGAGLAQPPRLDDQVRRPTRRRRVRSLRRRSPRPRTPSRPASSVACECIPAGADSLTGIGRPRALVAAFRKPLLGWRE